eukprot:6007931-Amphidinium_carterae.1
MAGKLPAWKGTSADFSACCSLLHSCVTCPLFPQALRLQVLQAQRSFKHASSYNMTPNAHISDCLTQHDTAH